MNTDPQSQPHDQTSDEIVGFDPAAYLATYTPSAGRAARCWPETRSFVTDLVLRLRLTSKSDNQYAAWVLAGVAGYALTSGTPLDPEHLLHPDFVERYINTAFEGPMTEGSLRTVRERLRRYGPELTRKAPWQPRPVRLPRSHLAAPYTASEIGQIFNALSFQSSHDRSRMEYLMYLGLGCGLDGRWATRVQSNGIGSDGVGLHITVPNPQRTVTCSVKYEDRLRAAIAGAPWAANGRVFRDQAELNSFTFRVNKRLGATKVHLSRLRSTWLMAHLEARTPLPVLLYGAGLKTTGPLAELVERFGPPSASDAELWLRGA